MTQPKSTPELDATVAASLTTAVRGDLAPWSSPDLAEGAAALAGRYEIVGLLGAGGMGAVYKAKDLELGELVALKALRPELSGDPGMIARFRQEVKLARRVTHPNVARTFDIGEHGALRFLTMELIEGESLASLLARECPTIARVVELGSAICAGLSAAHAAGVVHRDLKPDNVLLGDDGRIVVTDFGIARMTDPEAHDAVQTVGAPLGTPAYMAPEQVEGKRDIDARADVYALGAMLYELFTGTRPWNGSSVFTIAGRRLVEDPPDPRAVRPDLPRGAAELVLRCMARLPEARFQTAADVASALADITGGTVSTAAPRRDSRAPLSGVVGKGVAVLPFRNSGAPGDEYLADGITDDLIDVLSMTPGLRVCARGVVMARARGARDPQDVGRELGVDAVVEGSIRRAGERLRVTARVLSVTDGFQLWAQRFDRDEAAFFEVSDELAGAVAEALTCKLVERRRGSPDAIALDLYLRARHEYFKFWREGVILAVDLFEDALDRAPDDATILAGYAMALTRRMGHDDGTDAHAEAARRAAERALALAPRSAAARTALASYHHLAGSTVTAAREVRAVLQAHPHHADAVELAGRILVECGPAERGVERLHHALVLEPKAITIGFEIARVSALLGDRATTESLLADEPTEPTVATIYWINRLRTALWLGDQHRAKVWRPRFEARTDVLPGVMMMLRAMTGEPPADAQIAAVHAVGPSNEGLRRRRSIRALLACEFASSLGRTEIALDALETADAAELVDATWVERCPVIRRLEDEPRFLVVKQRVLARAHDVRVALGPLV